jgi:thiol-disulfide isomerase/thioredoxin
MKLLFLLLFTFHFSLFIACRPAATPISVSEKPISINNVPQPNLPFPPSKNVENLGWTGADGKRWTLLDYRGKVVVLDFWATYCPPCLEEIPHLIDLQNRFGIENFQIVGLNAGGEDDAPKVPEFVERLKMNYPTAAPEDELINVLLGNNSAIPQTLVFDRNGKLVEKFVGYDLNVKNNLEKAVERAHKQ